MDATSGRIYPYLLTVYPGNTPCRRPIFGGPAWPYLIDMAKVHSREIPYLTPRPFEDGSGWYVEAQWIGRPAEKLGRFATSSEARDWIALESTPHFVLRELGQTVKNAERSSS
jgi:hypothetical protein